MKNKKFNDIFGEMMHNIGLIEEYEPPKAVAPENDTTGVVGEVVLAPGFVTERCRRKGWPLEHEIPLLVVHGILHILGWDHASEAETVAMQAVEEEILFARGLPHPLRERS